MSKISGSIPNFANGVSQQAMALRLATQGDLQVNAYSTIVDGLKKRPPTQMRARLGAALHSSAFSHTINRDAFERYTVVATPSGIQVFDLTDGTEKTVNAPNGYGYLSYNTLVHERPPYRALTVGDTTFLVNADKTATLDGTVVEQPSPSEALIHVLAGNYGKTYKVFINNALVAQYRTPDGQSAAQSPAVDTTFIAKRLFDGTSVTMGPTVNGAANGGWTWHADDKDLVTTLVWTSTYTVKHFKNTIYLKRNDGAAFSIAVDDGYNGHAMKAIRKSTQDFSDLPAYSEGDVAVEIAGSIGTEFDNYFVRFNRQDVNSSLGVWKEIPQPGIVKALSAATMPHILVREANGTFTFKRAVWDQRKAGNDATCPPPSFIGQKINEVLFFKNRLGFLSGENVILSRHGSYFDFWRATATALLDDDPIDIAAVDNGVSVLRSAVASSDRLVLFADQMQFTLMGNELLTPKTASIRPTTSFASSSIARPARAGSSIFFAVDRGQYTMIRDYRIDANTGVAEASDVTGHVPQYIPGSALRIAASTHEDIVVVQPKGDPTSLYAYKYYWANDQLLQSSWSQWTFPGVTAILDMSFIDSQLVMVVNRGADAFIETMDVQPGGVDPYCRFVINLDRRFMVENFAGRTYDVYSNETTVTVPNDMTGSDFICVTAGAASPILEPGLEIKIVSKTSTHVVLAGDLRNVPLYFGTKYEMRYRMSTIHIRQESANGGVSVITEGRLQLLSVIIQYSRTSYFKIEVAPMARPVRTYVSSGRLMGDPNNRVDVVNLSDGSVKVPILSKNDRVTIDIVNDSYLPSNLLSAEWLANYVRKSQRI